MCASLSTMTSLSRDHSASVSSEALEESSTTGYSAGTAPRMFSILLASRSICAGTAIPPIANAISLTSSQEIAALSSSILSSCPMTLSSSSK